jgi:hypothetical protein
MKPTVLVRRVRMRTRRKSLLMTPNFRGFFNCNDLNKHNPASKARRLQLAAAVREIRRKLNAAK